MRDEAPKLRRVTKCPRSGWSGAPEGVFGAIGAPSSGGVGDAQTRFLVGLPSGPPTSLASAAEFAESSNLSKPGWGIARGPAGPSRLTPPVAAAYGWGQT